MKTLSDKQLAANRANAAKSTGPRTPEGKARAAANARKHGLAASSFTIAGLETGDTLQNLIADAVDHYRPQDGQEQFAVERIALAQLAILRSYRLEAGALVSSFDAGRKLVLGATLGIPDAQRDTQALAEGFHLMAGDGQSFALLLRYQAQADRQYRRAVQDFERLKAQREDFPNEPISEENKPDIPEPPEPVPVVDARPTFPQPPVPSPQYPAAEGGAVFAPATIVTCSPSTASFRR